MNKRGILILSVVVAAAVGLFLYMRRDRGESAPTPAATQKGSAQHAPAPIEKDEPAKLVITVSDDKGPLPGAMVRLERERGDVETVQTGSDGVARTGALEPGTWSVSASADGHEPAALRGRELHAGEVINVELKLAVGGRTLTGTVTDATGGPISGARIDAAKVGLGRRGDAVASTLTGTDGKYKLTVAEGQLLVAASESSYSPQSRYVEVGASGATADFQLVPGGVIEGIVRDEKTREPIANATVFAERDAPAMMLGERAVHDATTKADGRFRIAGLRPGAYELRAQAPQRASQSPTIVGIGVAEQVSDVEILVGSAPSIRGIVVDENGAPAPNVQVSAFSGPGDSAEGRSDAKGNFVIEGLSEGRYMLMGRSDQFVPAGTTNVELANKDVDGVKVSVRHGLRIKGHVEKRQICDVSLEMDEEGFGRGARMPMLLAPVTTGPDGEFDLGPAQEAAYELTARCASGEQGSKKIDAKAGMPDVVLEVKPGASIAGKVVDGAGKAVGGVAVMATPIGGTERTTIVNGVVTSGVQALTNAAGAFELRGLAAGAYRLRVLDRGRPLPMKSDAKVSLTAVERKTGVTLTVDRPDGVVRGVVTGSDGKPIADAWVSLHQDIRDMIGEAMDRESGSSRMIAIESSDDGGDTGGIAPALTDASGKFEIRNLARVPWTVVAEAQAGKVRGRAVKVVPDADIKITAVGLTKLEGKVIAPAGMPSSFHVELDGPTEAQRSFASKDGSFSFSRIDPGDYTVTVSSSAGNGRATIKVVPEQTATVEITLAANAVVIGKLVDTAGKPLGGVPVVIIPDPGAGGPLRVELSGPPPTSNPDGTFRLEAKAGTSVLMVMTPPRPTSKRGLKLEAGKTLDVGAIVVGADQPQPPPPSPP